MNATLEEGRCDVVIGVPDRYDLVRRPARTTDRRTSSSIRRARAGRSRRSTIRVLKKLKIGVHLLGDDYTNPPPVHELSKRGVVENVVGFSTFYSAENPPSAIIDAVAAGRIDLAIVWGPVAGYYAETATRAAGAGADSVRQGRSALRVRHLDGREEGQRGAVRACRASAWKSESPRSRRS